MAVRRSRPHRNRERHPAPVVIRSDGRHISTRRIPVSSSRHAPQNGPSRTPHKPELKRPEAPVPEWSLGGICRAKCVGSASIALVFFGRPRVARRQSARRMWQISLAVQSAGSSCLLRSMSALSSSLSTVSSSIRSWTSPSLVVRRSETWPHGAWPSARTLSTPAISASVNPAVCDRRMNWIRSAELWS
jgi:hypothetical protein